MRRSAEVLESAVDGRVPSPEEAHALLSLEDLEPLMEAARAIRDAHHHETISYSRKVFIPLTHLCRDTCHYCTFAQAPRAGDSAYMSPEAVLGEAKRARARGCKEALFTLGDKPELRYGRARDALRILGHESTHSYLRAIAERVHREIGLFPHLNPGVLTAQDLHRLRPVAVSMGLMLETTSSALAHEGRPHHGSPDKIPSRRLRTIALAGEASIPFTSGILIGIGETRRDRIESLLALRTLHERYGHLQEVIIQSFRAKPGTRMASAPEPSLDELLWTISVARIVLGGAMNIQAPPNLTRSSGELPRIITAGINDWGGISPITPDFVNPEAPWPEIEALARATESAGKALVERLAIYPSYALEPARWVDEGLRSSLLASIDALGFAREDGWFAGSSESRREAPRSRSTLGACMKEWEGTSAHTVPRDAVRDRAALGIETRLFTLLDRAMSGVELGEEDIVRLFSVRGSAFQAVTAASDALRARVCGDTVSYVVNRNINYTNICTFKCGFCAFSKGKVHESLRGRPYDLPLEEIVRRAAEAWTRGATEVCMQGGIHPDYDGETYLAMCRALKRAVPGMHIHAFSPLEIREGARSSRVSIREFLMALKEAGLGSLPGTAAEILDDEVRARICPDKLLTSEWMHVMETAHEVGLPTTATIMFGHADHPRHWARHLLRLRRLQAKTSGFTELVPLPFVHMEAPIALKGRARHGPTLREAILMHAIARLVLHPHFAHVQTSWVKMGRAGVLLCLDAGADDLGGTLMNESITRAAGASHGEEVPPLEMERIIAERGRRPMQRTTTYRAAPQDRVVASFDAKPLALIHRAMSPPSALRPAPSPDRGRHADPEPPFHDERHAP